MKILHTSDWHVGKTIRGRSRLDEHRVVLAEIGEVAADRQVDLVLVAGDLFETASPAPDAERVVYEALLALAAVAPVVVIAGNHDHPRRLEAVAPLLELGRVYVASAPRPADDGGVHHVTVASGERARVALVPFVSQRSIVRADELMSGAAFEHTQAYAERMGRIVDALTANADPDAANVLVGHLFAAGAEFNERGGERLAHTVFEYWVPPQCFPPSLGYVALGHLHRAQSLAGATAIHYCGSPLQLDFGEEGDRKQVNVVDVAAGTPAKVEAVPVTAGRRLRTLTGSADRVAADIAALDDECWLRVVLREPRRAGLADDLRAAVGARSDWVVDIRIDAPDHGPAARREQRLEGRSPQELFAAYLGERGVDDPRLGALFAELYEEASA